MSIVEYPSIEDINFYEKIFNKKEFQIYLNKFKIEKFSLEKYQSIVKNYLSPYTPYRNVLLFWAPGSGKTLGVISIAEQFYDKIKIQNEIYHNTSKIYIITKTTVAISQFERTLLDRRFIKKYITEKESIEFDKAREECKENLENCKTYKNLKNKYLRRLKDPNHGGYYKFYTYSGFRRKSLSSFSDHSLFIFDEAHEIETNTAQDLLYEIKDKFKDIRIILASATPVNTFPREIVNILNFLRDDRIVESSFFKEGMLIPGKEKEIGKLSQGLVSFIRPIDLKHYPQRIDMGEILPGFKKIKLVPCELSKFHYNTIKYYMNKTSEEDFSDISRHIYDFILPFRKNGELLLDRTFKNLEQKKMATRKGKKYYITSSALLSKEKLKEHGIKFYKMLEILGEKSTEPQTFLIYHNYISKGINLIEQILRFNGYIGRNEEIKSDTKCYLCGVPRMKHRTVSHVYYPARFVVLSGDVLKHEREKIISEYKSVENLNGSRLKIIVGSKIIRESIDFTHIKNIIIMHIDDSMNMIEQIIGRAIRLNSHKSLPKPERYVKVSILCTTNPDKTTSIEENQYQTQETRFIDIKKIERQLKINAFDCPLNKLMNVSPELVEKFKKCKKDCPLYCEYDRCDFTCTYSEYHPVKLDISTYDFYYSIDEIKIVKKIIKKLFTIDIAWDLEILIKQIMKNLTLLNHGLAPYVDPKYIIFVLNNLVYHREPIKNRFGKIGRIIKRKNFYIFNPGEEEKIPFIKRDIPFDTEIYTEYDIESYVNKILVPQLINIKSEIKKIYSYKTDKQLYKNLKILDITIQKQILEYFIEQNYFKKELPMVKKIFKFYKNFLINEKRLIENSYTKNSITILSKDFAIKDVIGHIYNIYPVVFDGVKWSKLDKFVKPNVKPIASLNKIYGINDLLNGKMVFKIIIQNKNEDKRKINRGMVCNTKNHSELKKIYEKISGRKMTEETRNSKDVCNEILDLLMELDEKNRPKRYFIDYIELFYLRKKGFM